MLTGRQIREARTLSGLTGSRLAYKVGRVTTLAIPRAEAAADGSVSSLEHAAGIRRTSERGGVEFTADPPGARLRSVDPT